MSETVNDSAASPEPAVNDEAPSATQETPALPPEIMARMEQLERESKANLEGWQRERADFQNYKKRAEQQLRDSRETGALEALKHVLPIVDDFTRAVENVPADLKDNPWVSGTSMILKKLERLLETHHVQIIDPVGQAFDPHLHEAVGMDDSSDYASGTVTTTLQRGYISGERVLRQALVRVAS